MTITKCDGWITARAGDEIVMMNTEGGKYIGLNAIGTRIWELLDTLKSTDALCDRLVGEFEIAPDRCRAEVSDFIATLKSHAAVVVDA